MKLARRLAIALALGIAAVMVVNVILRLRAESAAFESDSVRDLRVLGRGIGTAVEVLWRADGEARARRFIHDVNSAREEVEVRWVSLQDDEGKELFRRLSSKQRRDFAGRRDVYLAVRDPEGEDRRFSYTPVSPNGQRPTAAVEVSESREAEARFLSRSRRIALATAIGLVTLCSLIAIAVGMWFVGRPMKLLIEKARRVGAGDLSGPLRLTQKDEIGELAEEINAMCDRLADANRQASEATEARIAAIEQLRHADRLKTVGQLASGVAHELGTPLNVVSGHARMLREGGLTPGEVASSAEVIAEQGDRMTEIIRQLLDFSRRRGGAVERADLRDIAGRTLDMLMPLAHRTGIEVHLDSPDAEVPVEVVGNQISQALSNVVINGFQAMPGGGKLDVAVGLRAAQPPPDIGEGADTFAVIDVRDHGAGIPPTHLPHLFEPFFTTKDVGEGSGLGLAVAYGIVRDHGGWIDVESRPGEGARFSIYLGARGAARDGGSIGAA